MAKQVFFYVFSTQTDIAHQTTGALSVGVFEKKVCELIANLWREGKRILVACQSEKQAMLIDECLWQLEPEWFVPHNLSGEITAYPTPVEISWADKRNSQRRDVLINLQDTIPEFANLFQQVIDFVPADEQQKILARERYKQYRQLGWQLTTENV